MVHEECKIANALVDEFRPYYLLPGANVRIGEQESDEVMGELLSASCSGIVAEIQ